MAERGVYVDLEDNPFSFKAFVGVKEKKNSKNQNDLTYLHTDDIFGVNDKKSDQINTDSIDKGLKIESKGLNNNHDSSFHYDYLDEIKINQATKETIPSLAPLVSKENTSSGKKAHPKDNPFSFKKFLSSSSNPKKGYADQFPKAPEISRSSAVTDQKSHHINISTKPIVPINNPADLSPNESFQPIKDIAAGVGFDFPAASVDLNHFASESLNSCAGDNSEQLLLAENDNECDITLGGEKRKQSLPLGLPDFLSDGAALQVYHSPFDLPEKVAAAQNYDDLLEKIAKLQEENSRLKLELNRERQLCSDKNEKLLQLNIDLERQKKKELEETAVLERAVQQVEETLVTTTKRAVQAEANVSTLKKEVKSLQSQIKSLRQENEAYKINDGLSDIRERTKYTSDQLQSAAVVAERNIKELMSGVDKLKMLAQVLASLEKVSSIPQESSPDGEAKSP